jgi:predicted DNA-binding transcriptional regulator AlpA
MRARTFNEPAVSAAPDEAPSDRASRAIELLREALSLLASNDAHTALHLATEDRLIKLPDVERLTGMKRSAIYELIQRGAFSEAGEGGPREARCGRTQLSRRGSPSVCQRQPHDLTMRVRNIARTGDF